MDDARFPLAVIVFVLDKAALFGLADDWRAFRPTRLE
jgi:hypothetical protein